MMSNTQARDEKMYDFTDFRHNIHMDNTRGGRQEEMDKKNEDRMMRVRLHTQQNQKRTWKEATKFNSTLNSYAVEKIEKKF